MNKASCFADYSYFNHNGKCVTFNYNSDKRCKGKVLNYLKGEHQEGNIIKFLDSLGLELKNIKSNKYIHYTIIDKEV